MDSQTERGVKYLVDMKLGVCSCSAGQDGSPIFTGTAWRSGAVDDTDTHVSDDSVV